MAASADSTNGPRPKGRPRGKPFAKGAPSPNPLGRPRAEQERGYLDSARRAVPVAAWRKAVAACLKAAVENGDAKSLLCLARLLPGALAPDRLETTATVVGSLEPGPLTPEVASAAAAYAEALAAARRPAPPSA